MTKRNRAFTDLAPTYLFHEVNLRKKRFLEQHPDAKLISLSIGDTTEPIPKYVAEALSDAAANLGTSQGYSGYGPEQGNEELRQQLADRFYQGHLSPDEIFISDGAKTDLARLQQLFGNSVSIAVQDPTYPVYVDGSLLQGVQEVVRLPCSPANHFWPDWQSLPRTDLIYWCSPNNPTGATSTRAQLRELVALAKARHSIILFDAAYATYVQGSDFPRSIYEIAGAQEVAIEVNSFSKMAGFSGVRLGWTVVPAALKYADGASVRDDWRRLITTLFNGASNIAQKGGIAVLQPQGWKEIQALIRHYLENAALLKQSLKGLGYTVFGGDQIPYLWVHFPGRTSWEVFQEWLDKAQLITTPGSGFGACGEGFLRLSAFAKRESILEAIERLNAKPQRKAKGKNQKAKNGQ